VEIREIVFCVKAAYRKPVLVNIQTKTASNIDEYDSCEVIAKREQSHERLIHVVRAENLEN
jgi:hypothetical protein